MLSMIFIGLLSSHDPYDLDQYQYNDIIFKYANSVDHAVELHAIAFTESRFQPDAVSHTADYGMFQVNCNVWWKYFGYVSKRECKRQMMYPDVATKTAVKILSHYRKNYSQCRSSYAYLCYNGGPGWSQSKNKEKIVHYRRKVLERFDIIKQRYQNFFANVLSNRYNQHLQQCQTQEDQSYIMYI